MVDDGSSALAPLPSRPWVLIIGDSITEGIGAGGSLGDYAFLVGQGLRGRGVDTGVSACGYSGWLRPGDGDGDVLPYYNVRDGAYVEKASRWNKIDSRTSLLDANGHLSGQGNTAQEPATILINYIVNETLSHSNPADAQASVSGCLVRKLPQGRARCENRRARPARAGRQAGLSRRRPLPHRPARWGRGLSESQSGRQKD